MGGIKNGISNLNSYTKLIDTHIIKVKWAISKWDKNLIIYYQKETQRFIDSGYKIISSLNKHESVMEATQKFELSIQQLQIILQNHENH